MPRDIEGIHWAPKVNPAKIWQLYQNDARGTVDNVLVADVGKVANNLIAGAHRDVVALLDKLAYNGTVDAAEAKAQWRATVQTMWRRRRGQL